MYVCIFRLYLCFKLVLCNVIAFFELQFVFEKTCHFHVVLKFDSNRRCFLLDAFHQETFQFNNILQSCNYHIFAVGCKANKTYAL